MPSVILIALLLLGLAAGFYVSQKAKSFARDGQNTPGKLLYKQLRRQAQGWVSDLRKKIGGSNDDSSSR